MLIIAKTGDICPHITELHNFFSTGRVEWLRLFLIFQITTSKAVVTVRHY